MAHIAIFGSRNMGGTLARSKNTVMTLITLRGQLIEHCADVATFAIKVSVVSVQRKTGCRVVKLTDV